jgi:PDZ domain protein
VDNKLIVTKVEPGSQAEKFGIKFNDRIVEVERERVKTRPELLNKIADKQSFTLVFSRKDFQFFVKVSPK